MKTLMILISLVLLLTACANPEEKERISEQNNSVQNENNIEAQTVITNEVGDEVQSEKITKPFDFEKAVKTWHEEIEKWYSSSSAGAIEVIPIKEDYTHLNVTMHNNLQPLDEDGRTFIADDVTGDLQSLVNEIFKYEGEVLVEFEFQDGSPLLPVE